MIGVKFGFFCIVAVFVCAGSWAGEGKQNLDTDEALLPLSSQPLVAEAGSPVFDMSLEQLLNLKINVASRRDETVRDSPAVITVVTRKDIEAFGARNLIDIMNRLPGMQVLGHAGFYGNKTQVRAQPNSSQDRHLLFLLNGRPVRENINGGNNAYFYQGFPVSAIESIEVIRGPGSVLYGSNAFAAVVNIKTRTVDKGTVGGEASTTYGTYDTLDNDGRVTGCTESGIDYLVSMRRSRSDGPRITWVDSNGVRDDEQYREDADSVYVNVGKGDHRFQAAYHRYSPGEYGTLGRHLQSIYISEVETFFADAGTAFHLTDDLSFHLNTTLNTFHWEGSNDGDSVFTRRFSKNLIVEPMVKYVPIKDFNLVVGSTLEFDEFGGAELFAHKRHMHTFYGQADYQITDWLKPLVGIQYNKTENAAGDYSPRFGLILTPGKNWGGKLLYGEAFRRPFAAEEYLDSNFLTGNTSLKPETIKTYEAQINYQNEKCQFDLTYYHSTQKVIEVDSSASPLHFVNFDGQQVVEGLELTGRYQLGRHWQILGSGTVHWLDNDIKDPLTAPNYSAFMLKGGVRGEFDSVEVGVFNSYFADGSWRHQGFNNLQANVKVDLSRSLHLPEDRLTLSIMADNLLDEKPSSLRSDIGVDEPLPQYHGRRFFATLKLTW